MYVRVVREVYSTEVYNSLVLFQFSQKIHLIRDLRHLLFSSVLIEALLLFLILGCLLSATILAYIDVTFEFVIFIRETATLCVIRALRGFFNLDFAIFMDKLDSFYSK